MSKPGSKPYKWIKNPDGHSQTTKKGLIQEHRLIAEQIVKRLLKSEEVVHHIDEDTLNNDIENLMVFATAREHNAFHMGAPTWSNDGKIWHASQITHSKKCKQCGKIFIANDKGQIFCNVECANQNKKRVNNKRIKEIQTMLYKHNGNFSYVAKILNVSSSGLAKLLKTHNLPHHSKDYKMEKAS